MQGNDEVYSEKIKAGKRTYFFDVRPTRSDDYYITITESKRKPNGRGYEKHKIFLYKEDFNKFLATLTKAVEHVKTDLMPDYDFDEFDRRREQEGEAEEGEERDDFGGYTAAALDSIEVGDSLSARWDD